MKIGFLFPGQGAQSVGMGKDLYEKYDSVRKVYNQVKEITNIDVADISFNGSEEKLNQTKYTQICILTMSLAILEILKENQINATVSSGLSLGEYTALIYSNLIDFKQGIKIVQKRGEYMQDLAPKGDWLMAAIIGMSENQIKKVCNQVEKGFVVPANFNTTGQIVISGEKQAVEQAEVIAKQEGAKKVRELKTAGPFHTEKLINASQALRKELERVTLHDFESQVIKNIDGTLYTKNDDIKDILSKHIISPVRFTKSLETMLEMGVDTFIEVGPRKNIIRIYKKIR